MTDPTYSQPGTFDPLRPGIDFTPPGGGPPVVGNLPDGHQISYTYFDEPHSEPEVSIHEVTYSGRIDLRAGSHLGPGVDGRQVVVGGCIWDPATNKTTVVVEAQTPLLITLDAPAVHAFASAVAQAFNRSVADKAELTAAGRS